MDAGSQGATLYLLFYTKQTDIKNISLWWSRNLLPDGLGIVAPFAESNVMEQNTSDQSLIYRPGKVVSVVQAGENNHSSLNAWSIFNYFLMRYKSIDYIEWTPALLLKALCCWSPWAVFWRVNWKMCSFINTDWRCESIAFKITQNYLAAITKLIVHFKIFTIH